MNAEPTGTDGIRLLCHQFFPSSLPLPENCLTSSKTFSLKMNKLREALLLLYNIGGQGRETRQMVSPLQHGRLCMDDPHRLTMWVIHTDGAAPCS